jgi:hypothetical protein
MLAQATEEAADPSCQYSAFASRLVIASGAKQSSASIQTEASAVSGKIDAKTMSYC